MGYVDAHNHLQDDRFGARLGEIVEQSRRAGVERMVVNGSCEEDWPAVAEVARRYPDLVIPAFGLHPWYVHTRSAGWMDVLNRHLDGTPGAVVGEIGLDRWILECPPAARAAVAGHLGDWQVASLGEQEEVFTDQLAVAEQRGVAASIHCLQAWGRMHGLLRECRRPACGFLLHSYGGSAEMVGPLSALGGFFSFPGYFLHARKARQREAFRAVPLDRLLVETDAPDQRLPRAAEWRAEKGRDAADGGGSEGAADAIDDEWMPILLESEGGKELNHPGNLAWVYRGLAEVRGLPVRSLVRTVGEGFERLFGSRNGV